jgi:hypothetical protein
MTVGNVQIEKHDKGVGWYKITITSLEDFVGQTTTEMLIREESLRKLRNEADRALADKPRPNPLDALKDK